jgi:hypothetical protein
MLLTVLLLPADLQGFARDLQSGVQTVAATAGKFLARRDEVQVADASPRLTLGGKSPNVQ